MSPEGIVRIKGTGITINRIEQDEVIRAWIDDYLNNPAETTFVSIALENLNSNCSGKLASILRRISQVSMRGKKLVVHWYVNEDDDDIKERGEQLSLALNIPIEFIVTKDNISQ